MGDGRTRSGWRVPGSVPVLAVTASFLQLTAVLNPDRYVVDTQPPQRYLLTPSTTPNRMYAMLEAKLLRVGEIGVVSRS